MTHYTSEALFVCYGDEQVDRWGQVGASVDYAVFRWHCDLWWEQGDGGWEPGEVEVWREEELNSVEARPNTCVCVNERETLHM